MKSDKSTKSSLWLFIVKIWTVHIIALVIYLFVLLLIAEIIGDTLSVIIATILSTIVYFVFVYIDAWRTGQRDYNLVKYGHIKENKYKGLEAGVISQVPGLILSLLCIFTSASIYSKAYRWVYLFFCYVVNMIPYGFGYFIPLIFAPITSTIAYNLGYRGARISDKLVFAQGKNYENLR